MDICKWCNTDLLIGNPACPNCFPEQPERLNPETQCKGCKMDKEYPRHAMYVDHTCKAEMR